MSCSPFLSLNVKVWTEYQHCQRLLETSQEGKNLSKTLLRTSGTQRSFGVHVCMGVCVCMCVYVFVHAHVRTHMDSDLYHSSLFVLR